MGAGHDHDHRVRNERRLAVAAALTGGFMLAEVAGGLISGSLALLADAGHMLTDFASLALAWGALRLARRPADWKRTYGFDRFAVLAAFVNGVTLFAIAAWITVEAVRRFLSPIEVLAGPMLVIAVLGLLVNIAAFWVLQSGEKGNLNVRAAALHVMGDLLGSVAAITAALVIMWTGWMPIDPLLSVFVALLILRAAWRVVSESGHILLEGTPPGLDLSAVADDLAALPGVAGVHHLHAWSVDESRPMMTLEARIRPEAQAEAVRRAIKARLAEHHGIDHATVEIQWPSSAAAPPGEADRGR